MPDSVFGRDTFSSTSSSAADGGTYHVEKYLHLHRLLREGLSSGHLKKDLQLHRLLGDALQVLQCNHQGFHQEGRQQRTIEQVCQDNNDHFYQGEQKLIRTIFGRYIMRPLRSPQHQQNLFRQQFAVENQDQQQQLQQLQHLQQNLLQDRQIHWGQYLSKEHHSKKQKLWGKLYHLKPWAACPVDGNPDG